MVIGDGLLARAFKDFDENPNVLIYASGVSNSSERRPDQFERERALLTDTLSKQSGLVIYFSTCSIYDDMLQAMPYVMHKLEMEALIKAAGHDYIVFRLPQVVGATPNPHTLTNFFRDRLLSGERFNVWAKASRTIIDVADVRALAGYFIAHTTIRNRAINLYPPVSSTALQIVMAMECVLGLKGDYSIEDRGSAPELDAPEILGAAEACGIHFTSDYPEQVLRKYYGQG